MSFRLLFAAAIVALLAVRCGAPNPSGALDFRVEQEVAYGTSEVRSLTAIQTVTEPTDLTLKGLKVQRHLCVMIFMTTTWKTVNGIQHSELGSRKEHVLAQTKDKASCSGEFAADVEGAEKDDPGMNVMVLQPTGAGSDKLALVAPKGHALIGKPVATLGSAAFALCPNTLCRLVLTHEGAFELRPYSGAK